MKHTNRKWGFSLVELMIAVAIVAILVALALPSYSRYVRKANRGEAQSLLLNWANNQELWRANNATYAADSSALGEPSHGYYDFATSAITATTYTLTATAKAGTGQVDDEERGNSCTPMALDQSNLKTPADCW